MKTDDEGLVHGTVIRRPDGKQGIHAFGFRCRCVSVNKEEGTVTFKQDADPRIRFVLPAFGPGEHNKTDKLDVKPGDECWLEMSRCAVAEPGKEPD